MWPIYVTVGPTCGSKCRGSSPFSVARDQVPVWRARRRQFVSAYREARPDRRQGSGRRPCRSQPGHGPAAHTLRSRHQRHDRPRPGCRRRRRGIRRVASAGDQLRPGRFGLSARAAAMPHQGLAGRTAGPADRRPHLPPADPRLAVERRHRAAGGPGPARRAQPGRHHPRAVGPHAGAGLLRPAGPHRALHATRRGRSCRGGRLQPGGRAGAGGGHDGLPHGSARRPSQGQPVLRLGRGPAPRGALLPDHRHARSGGQGDPGLRPGRLAGRPLSRHPDDHLRPAVGPAPGHLPVSVRVGHDLRFCPGWDGAGGRRRGGIGAGDRSHPARLVRPGQPGGDPLGASSSPSRTSRPSTA